MATMTCPQCGRLGRVPEGFPAGARVKCPGCGERFTPVTAREPEPVAAVPAPVAPARVIDVTPAVPTPAPAPVRETTACAFCGEEVLKVAVKCKHCGETLDVKLRAQEAKAASAPPPAPTVVIHNTNTNVVSGGSAKRWSRAMAMLLSLVWPGLGQIYKGQVFNGLVWMVLTLIGYVFIFPGLALHLLCVIGAGMGDTYR